MSEELLEKVNHFIISAEKIYEGAIELIDTKQDIPAEEKIAKFEDCLIRADTLLRKIKTKGMMHKLTSQEHHLLGAVEHHCDLLVNDLRKQLDGKIDLEEKVVNKYIEDLNEIIIQEQKMAA